MAESEAPRSIMQAIAQVQRSVVIPKGKYNEFGNFYYRSFEDIVAALKQPCEEAGISFFMSDEVVNIGERYYVKATVCVFFTDQPGEMFTVSAYAREAERKSGSDEAQLTGMASSYARKYALCGAFAIDGERDPDALEREEPAQPPEGPFLAHCRSCGTRYQFNDMAQFEAFTANPGCCPAPSWEIEG